MELIVKKGPKKCEHNRQKSLCKECGGSSICIHGRQKSTCKECGGISVCEHGRQKSTCKECGGISVCEHGRQKSTCKECGGISVCEHGRQKSTCKECKGSSICEHGRQKSTCKECKGSSICEHGRQKSTCKECGGISVCEHGRQKAQCKECKGASICEHGRQKSTCKECKGTSICIHGRQKSTCKECGGSSLCRSSWCLTTGNRKYDGYCVPCFVNDPNNADNPKMRNHKTKEKDVCDFILQNYPTFNWVADRKVQDGCSRRRPDLLLELGSHIIIVEIDENKHSGYDCSCENKRLMEISQDLQHRPIIFIRFNPDSYTLNGKTIKSCWKLNKSGTIVVAKRIEWQERLSTLVQEIQYWIDNPTDKTVEIVELFY